MNIGIAFYSIMYPWIHVQPIYETCADARCYLRPNKADKIRRSCEHASLGARLLNDEAVSE